MYSRFQNRPEESLRIPEHYSGCAFSPASPASERPPEEPTRKRIYPMEAARPSPPPKNSPPPPPALLLPPQEEPTEKKPPSPPAQPILGTLGHAFPFSHGIGFEELLLLGLILLLAQNENSQDTLLWLALLLFCG